MDILMIGSFEDEQTAVYIGHAFKKLGHNVAGIDARLMTHTIGPIETQKKVMEEIKEQNIDPKVILILKGLELSPKTIKKI